MGRFTAGAVPGLVQGMRMREEDDYTRGQRVYQGEVQDVERQERPLRMSALQRQDRMGQMDLEAAEELAEMEEFKRNAGRALYQFKNTQDPQALKPLFDNSYIGPGNNDVQLIQPKREGDDWSLIVSEAGEDGQIVRPGKPITGGSFDEVFQKLDESLFSLTDPKSYRTAKAKAAEKRRESAVEMAKIGSGERKEHIKGKYGLEQEKMKGKYGLEKERMGQAGKDGGLLQLPEGGTVTRKQAWAELKDIGKQLSTKNDMSELFQAVLVGNVDPENLSTGEKENLLNEVQDVAKTSTDPMEKRAAGRYLELLGALVGYKEPREQSETMEKLKEEWTYYKDKHGPDKADRIMQENYPLIFGDGAANTHRQQPYMTR